MKAARAVFRTQAWAVCIRVFIDLLLGESDIIDDQGQWIPRGLLCRYRRIAVLTVLPACRWIFFIAHIIMSSITEISRKCVMTT